MDSITTTMNVIYAEHIAVFLKILEMKKMSLKGIRGKLGLPEEHVVEFEQFQREFIDTVSGDVIDVVSAEEHVMELYNFRYPETAKLFIELLFLHTEMDGNIRRNDE
jgi:hypothetical protein